MVYKCTYIKIFISLDRSWGIPCDLVTREKCQEIWPMLNVDDIQGGLWIPGDGVADPQLICKSLIKEAISNGMFVFITLI